MRLLSLCLTAGLFLGLSAVCAATGEEKDSASGKKEAPAQAKSAKKKPLTPAAEKPGKAPVYTNDDLERMFGSSAAPEGPVAETPSGEATEKTGPPKEGEPAKPEQAPPDPLKAMEDASARQADQNLKVAEAERAVAEASARVQELEKRALAIRNPFLPRPDLSPEEAEAMKGLSAPDSLQRTQTQLEEARKNLEEARARLAALTSGS